MITISLSSNLSDYDTIEKALPAVIQILNNSIKILAQVVNVPNAEPDDPVWQEFLSKPFIGDICHLGNLIFDASEYSKDLLNRVNAVPSA